MIRFNNDYNRGAHPEILKMFESANGESYGGYGIDEWCEKAKAEIGKYLECDNAKIHFTVGGTQVNYIVIAAALRPYQSVICADSGHINVHETGAVENSGHKVCAVSGKDGKITAEQIREQAELYAESDIKEHITQPKMVYISFPTEYGTIYTKAELESISAACRDYGLYLFVDGARMGYGLGAAECDVTLADFARLTDAFTIGGTKCGAMFGEAAVLCNPALDVDFRSYIKQNGALLAKGWTIGIQFYTLFRDGLYFEINKKAVQLAMMIKAAFEKKGIPSFMESPTNQQFVILENEQAEKLAEKFVFEFESKVDDRHKTVRFCTSWSTEEDDVRELVKSIEAL